jgi:hypothetical protein
MTRGCGNEEKGPKPKAASVVPNECPPTKFPSRDAPQQTPISFYETNTLSIFPAQAVHTPETMEVWHNGGGSRIAESAY